MSYNNKVIYMNRKPNSVPILPAKKAIEYTATEQHDAEPIKNKEDIMRISQYFIAKEAYRDNMLFITGINFGLRCIDLLELRFSDLINEDFTFKTVADVVEKKTGKTRNITINEAVQQAVLLFLQNNQKTLDSYMFTSLSNNSAYRNKPIAVRSVERMLKQAVKDLEIDVRAGTHMLRKTFGYQFMMNHDNGDQVTKLRALHLLQRIFNHSSETITLRYIGITGAEIQEAYKNLNLGIDSSDVSPAQNDSVINFSKLSQSVL